MVKERKHEIIKSATGVYVYWKEKMIFATKIQMSSGTGLVTAETNNMKDPKEGASQDDEQTTENVPEVENTNGSNEAAEKVNNAEETKSEE